MKTQAAVLATVSCSAGKVAPTPLSMDAAFDDRRGETLGMVLHDGGIFQAIGQADR